MANYYVRPDGLDTNNGKGPDHLSGGTDKPWKTIAKALQSTSIAQGDTLYIAPGIYRETGVTVNTTITTTTRTYVKGDPSGTLVNWVTAVTPGPVILTQYTDDTSRPGNVTLFKTANKGYFTFENIFFCSGQGSLIEFPGSGVPKAIQFIKCKFQSQASQIVSMSNAYGDRNTAGEAFDALFDRCVFSGRGVGLIVNYQTSSVSGNYDLGVTVKSCMFNSTEGIETSNVGTSAYGANVGIKIYNCTFNCGTIGLRLRLSYGGASLGSVTAHKVRNCHFINCQTYAMHAQNTGTDVDENYNWFSDCGTNRSGSISAGANSYDGFNSRDLGESFMWGLNATLPTGIVDNSVLEGKGTTDSGNAPTLAMWNSFASTPSIGAQEVYTIPTGSSGGGLLVHPGMTGRING